jgi:2,4-dienoyl-CoA reductase-like NADH-dependent reductase (Old Yellow Enzyme family)
MISGTSSKAPGLFDPITLRSLNIAHRGWVAAMCQYSCDPVAAPGVPNDWHLMHLGQFAAGGAAMIITEAAAVSPEARISPRDAGIYNAEQVAAWRRITDFIHTHGTAGTLTGIQLAHAGRKASTYWPFSGRHGSVAEAEGGWQTVGPTDEPFDGYAAPRAMTQDDILKVIQDFGRSAALAVEAGFDTVEIHGAHGYLLHQFLTPLVNTRTDGWGGSEEGRFRLTLEVIDEVRRHIPRTCPSCCASPPPTGSKAGSTAPPRRGWRSGQRSTASTSSTSPPVAPCPTHGSRLARDTRWSSPKR